MFAGKLWYQHDRFGNEIYLTAERWQHIIDIDNHPEVAPYLDYVRETIKLGRRKQDPYDPSGYRYYRAFPDLPNYNTHLIVCVRFRWNTIPNDAAQAEKFIVTAYFQTFME